LSGSCVKFLPDYAEGESKTGYTLHKVGIKKVEVYRKDFEDNLTITQQAAYVSLKQMKGIHMSRLVGIMLEYANQPVELDDEMMDKFTLSQRAESSYWECRWKSIIELDDLNTLAVRYGVEAKAYQNAIDWYFTIGVPYASVCPCAHDMCKSVSDGVPHMQRAIAYVTGQVSNDIDLPDFSTELISRVIDVVDIIPKPYMKREDELEWCRRAAKKNLFVEDAARQIAKAVNQCFGNAVVTCEHFESIHEHNVVAIHRKGEGLL